MKKQILHVSIFQSAKVMAVLYFVFSIPLVLIIGGVEFTVSQGIDG